MDPIALGLTEYSHERERLLNILSPGAKALWDELVVLSREKVCRMEHLSTFSLALEAESGMLGFYIPRPVIATVISYLPVSCVNLEIDTKGVDHAEPVSTHLCEFLRAILPRLRHLRLRLRFLCPEIFGKGFTAHGTVDDASNFEPISAPHLKTAMINCITKTCAYTGVCGTLEFPERPAYVHERGPEARICLASCLRLLVERSSFPEVQRLWMLDWQRPSDENGQLFASYNRRDVAKNKTWAIPCRRIWHSERNSVLIRTPEGVEGLSAPWTLETLAEDEIWEETTNGSRFPAEFQSDEDWQTQGYSKRELPLETVDAYRGRFPKRACGLWEDEKKAGVSLLGPVERDSLTDISPVVEMTPPGWTRSESPTQRLMRAE